MKRAILVFLFMLTAINLFALGRREKMNDFQHSFADNIETINAGAENTIKILGRVQIYGNEPHTFLGIIDENGVEYAVYPQSREEELRKLQGHLIEFTVIVLDNPQGYGSLFLRGGTVTPITWGIIQ